MAKKTPSIDPEQLKADAGKIGDTLVKGAQQYAGKAAELAQPYLKNAAEQAQELAERAKPYLDDAKDRVKEDYLPRINKAVAEAHGAALTDASLSERARLVRDASVKALTTPTHVKKSHRFLKFVGVSVLSASAAGVGYLLWKRSKPIEDPWAEEYWADLDSEEIAVDDVTPPELVEGVEQIDEDARPQD